MEKIIEWKEKVQNKLINKMLSNIVNFKHNCYKFLGHLTMNVILTFCCIKIANMDNIEESTLIDLIKFLFVMLTPLFMTISMFNLINLMTNFYFSTGGKNKLNNFIIKSIKNNQKIQDKVICFDSIYKNFKELETYKLSSEELQELITILKVHDKEKFENYLKTLEIDNLHDYNNIISFVSMLIDENNPEKIEKENKKERELRSLFKKNELLELEVNGNNKLNVNRLL